MEMEDKGKRKHLVEPYERRNHNVIRFEIFRPLKTRKREAQQTLKISLCVQNQKTFVRGSPANMYNRRTGWPRQ